jgi:hypothetical protein
VVDVVEVVVVGRRGTVVVVVRGGLVVVVVRGGLVVVVVVAAAHAGCSPTRETHNATAPTSPIARRPGGKYILTLWHPAVV